MTNASEIVYKIDIKLNEPTILTDGSSDTSGGHETFVSIPGNSVLGAMVRTLGIDPDRDSKLFAATFLGEATRFLNAYPVAGGQRTLPRPRSFRQGKLNRQTVIDGIDSSGRAVGFESIQQFIQQGVAADRVKAAAAAFVLTETPWIDRSPLTREQVHVAIARESRAAEQGVLFTYSSLPAGTEFRSYLITGSDRVAKKLEDFCGRPLALRIGRSRGGGYGAATGILTPESKPWQEYQYQAPEGDARLVIVTLLSDYIPWLELPVVAAFEEELRHVAALSAGMTVEVVEASVRTVTGFRGVWGLPRAPRTAIEKGAVFLLCGDLDGQQIRTALFDGLGSRRNEGFGRIAVNWNVHGRRMFQVETARLSPQPTPLVARPLASGKDAQRAKSVVVAMAVKRNEKLRRKFVEVVLANAKMKPVIATLAGGVPPAQLGNLRAAMSSNLKADAIGTWFTQLADKTAGDRWRSVRVPALRQGDVRRDGIGFVWTSLLGGTTQNSGRSDKPDGKIDFALAVNKSLKPLCGDISLQTAASADPDRTIRLFVIGLCGDVARQRNLKTVSAMGVRP